MVRELFLLIALLVYGVGSYAVDLNLERMLSPGELSRAHSGSDIDCDSCHKDFARHDQNILCLDCHKKIATDLNAQRGFHGKKPGIDNSECRICHTEHKGRAADIVQLNPHGFPHQFTEFPLLGKHKTLACEHCHKNDVAYRDTPVVCVECHKHDDIHKGRQGRNCQECHQAVGWRSTEFDHDKTRFPLTGAHQAATCRQCHRSSDYTEAETVCVSCHQLDDVHRNTFGRACDSCHVTSDWNKTQFDHAKDTDFKLLGSHRRLACVSCHKQPQGSVEQAISKTCYSCHQHDDVHQGKNGKDCSRCHNNQQWNKHQFNHQQTSFPLRGAHQKVECTQCHKSDIYAPIKNQSCYGCHQQQDVHRKTLGTDCRQCHNEQHWNRQIIFDHDLTDFPLLGMHAATFCESCHSDFQFKGIASACVDCHQNDDVHNGHLGNQCRQCHHPTGWSLWHFDHNQTDFILRGAHEGLRCNACHQQGLADFKRKGSQCGDCHQDDDVHRGAYGSQCQHCHSSKDFSRLNMR